MTEPVSNTTDPPPRHPFWCDCGGNAAFTIRGCQIRHHPNCDHAGETERDAERLYDEAKAWCLRNPGREIPAP